MGWAVSAVASLLSFAKNSRNNHKCLRNRCRRRRRKLFAVPHTNADCVRCSQSWKNAVRNFRRLWYSRLRLTISSLRNATMINDRFRCVQLHKCTNQTFVYYFDSHASHKHNANGGLQELRGPWFTVHQINTDMFFFLFFVSFQFAAVWIVNAYWFYWSTRCFHSFIHKYWDHCCSTIYSQLTYHNGRPFRFDRVERRNWFFPFQFDILEAIDSGSRR